MHWAVWINCSTSVNVCVRVCVWWWWLNQHCSEATNTCPHKSIRLNSKYSTHHKHIKAMAFGLIIIWRGNWEFSLFYAVGPLSFDWLFVCNLIWRFIVQFNIACGETILKQAVLMVLLLMQLSEYIIEYCWNNTMRVWESLYFMLLLILISFIYHVLRGKH